MLTEIGTLASIINNLINITRSAGSWFGDKQIIKKNEEFEKLKDRIAGMADQFEKSIELSKMLSIWLKEQNQIDLFADQLSDDDVRGYEEKLRYLIFQSIHDTFSGTFFRTKYSSLPGMEGGIEDFRKRLTDLEKQLNGIRTGNAVNWRLSWPILKQRLQDLRSEADNINNKADGILSSLVQELQKAGR